MRKKKLSEIVFRKAAKRVEENNGEGRKQNEEAGKFLQIKPRTFVSASLQFFGLYFFVCDFLAGHLKKMLHKLYFKILGSSDLKGSIPLHGYQLGSHSSTGRQQCKG